MPVDSIVIKLVRKGADISPDYSITIHGYGTVTYEGNDNVGVKGRIEESIDNEKVVSLLSEFKNAGFFSFDDKYPIKNPEGRPYNIISLTLPGESGEIRNKSITFYHGDQNAPKNLKKLGDKIDEITGSDKWIDAVSKPEELAETQLPVKEVIQKTSRGSKKIPVKLVAVAVSAIVVVAAVFLALNLGIIPINDGSDLSNGVKYDPPVISEIKTASSIINGVPLESNWFKKGESVYLYFEFKKVNHNGSMDISEEITVSRDKSYNYSEIDYDMLTNQTSSLFWDNYGFVTDNSWPVGKYTINLVLKDDISDESTSDSISFFLLESGASIPTAVISANPLSGDAPLYVNFVGSGENFTGDIVSYSWDFGDLSSSDQQSVTNTYEYPREYTVTLTITDINDVEASSSVQIQVEGELIPLNASISTVPENPEGSPPLEVSFYGAATGGTGEYTYYWDFGDGSMSTLQNPTHTFESDSLTYYKVTFTVTDTSGATSNAYEFVWCIP
jgi:PKD repeat protein